MKLLILIVLICCNGLVFSQSDSAITKFGFELGGIPFGYYWNTNETKHYLENGKVYDIGVNFLYKKWSFRYSFCGVSSALKDSLSISSDWQSGAQVSNEAYGITIGYIVHVTGKFRLIPQVSGDLRSTRLPKKPTQNSPDFLIDKTPWELGSGVHLSIDYTIPFFRQKEGNFPTHFGLTIRGQTGYFFNPYKPTIGLNGGGVYIGAGFLIGVYGNRKQKT